MLNADWLGVNQQLKYHLLIVFLYISFLNTGSASRQTVQPYTFQGYFILDEVDNPIS